MISKKTKQLKKELKDSELSDVKIAWQHLNWSWKIVFIIGIISTVWIFYKLGVYIGNLIG